MSLTRRQITRGVAWAAPAVLATAVVPAYAASTIAWRQVELNKSIQGSLQLGLLCRQGSYEFTLQGVTGATARQSFFVGGTVPNSQVTEPSFTLYLPTAYAAQLTWTANPNNAIWSMPEIDHGAPAIAGFTAYTTHYRADDWQYDASTGRHFIPHIPSFYARTASRFCPTNFQVYSLRKVKVDGTLYELQRGPAWLRSRWA